MEIAWISTNRIMDKQTVVYSHNKILLNNKKEQITHTHNVDEFQNPAGWKKLGKSMWFLLYEVLEQAKLIYGFKEKDLWFAFGIEWLWGLIRRGLRDLLSIEAMLYSSPLLEYSPRTPGDTWNHGQYQTLYILCFFLKHTYLW